MDAPLRWLAEGYSFCLRAKHESSSVPGVLEKRWTLFPISRFRRFDRILTVGWSLHIYLTTPIEEWNELFGRVCAQRAGIEGVGAGLVRMAREFSLQSFSWCVCAVKDVTRIPILALSRSRMLQSLCWCLLVPLGQGYEEFCPDLQPTAPELPPKMANIRAAPCCSIL